MKLLLENVSKKFENKRVIEQASYTFEKGKIYGLLGRNGAGKTTLFQCISKNLLIDDGIIAFEKNGLRQDYEATDIGFVHTLPRLPAFMTAYEFIKFFLDIHHHKIKQVKTPQEYLTAVGIKAEDHHRLLKDFSHGMQNKVQMIVVLIVQPPVLLLDEPLTSFDVVAAHEMKELILQAKSNSVVIFSTHILQLAQDLCDEVVLLHHKKLTSVDAANIHDNDFEEEVIHLLSDESLEQGEEGGQ